MGTNLIDKKFVFNREMVIKAFSEKGKNVMDFFHAMRLSPAQMMTFWESGPTTGKFLQLRAALREMGDERDIFEFVAEAKVKEKK